MLQGEQGPPGPPGPEEVVEYPPQFLSPKGDKVKAFFFLRHLIFNFFIFFMQMKPY